MVDQRIQEYQDKYADQLIRFNPYALKKTGLLQSRTLLKIEDYMLICAPYQLGMQRVVLLVILSRNEVVFFQPFLNKLSSLNLAFQRPANKNQINLFIRGTLVRLGPVKGKNNVCLFEMAFKSCPNDLIEIIGDYLMSCESLQTQFTNFKNRAVAMDEAAARTMRFNNYVEAQFGARKVESRLVSLAVNRIVLDLPSSVPPPQVGQGVVSKLYFQTYQFLVNGKVAAVETGEGGARRTALDIVFTPELVEIMDDYFFRVSFNKQQ
jgi:hypothetical protein